MDACLTELGFQMLLKWILSPPRYPEDRWGTPIDPKNPIKRWWFKQRYSWSHKLGKYLYANHPKTLASLGNIGHSHALSYILADELTKEINASIIERLKAVA